jgi:hypothetical protein
MAELLLDINHVLALVPIDSQLNQHANQLAGGVDRRMLQFMELSPFVSKSKKALY